LAWLDPRDGISLRHLDIRLIRHDEMICDTAFAV
jgi:hypothetical protein